MICQEPKYFFKYSKTLLNLLNGFLLKDMKEELVEGILEDAYVAYSRLQWIYDLFKQKNKKDVSGDISHSQYTCVEIIKFVDACENLKQTISPLLEEKPFYKTLLTISDLFQRGLEKEYRKP